MSAKQNDEVIGMVERMAAILNTTPDDYGSDYIARLILEAMREPTDAMVDAGMDVACDHPGCVFSAMIDAALNEQVSG